MYMVNLLAAYNEIYCIKWTQIINNRTLSVSSHTQSISNIRQRKTTGASRRWHPDAALNLSNLIQFQLLTPRYRLGVFFLSSTLSVCMYVCHTAPSNRFFFVSRWNQAIFYPSVLHVALYKLFSSILDLAPPPNAQNVLPKICTCTKSPITWLAWQKDRRCLHLLGGFRGWLIQWNHVQCCGADSCCHGNDICARRGV